MSLMDRIYDDIAKHLHLPPGSVVTKIEEENYESSSGCDTCGYGQMDEFTVYIHYIDEQSRLHIYSEQVKLVDFLNGIK